MKIQITNLKESVYAPYYCGNKFEKK